MGTSVDILKAAEELKAPFSSSGTPNPNPSPSCAEAYGLPPREVMIPTSGSRGQSSPWAQHLEFEGLCPCLPSPPTPPPTKTVLDFLH